MAFSQNSSSCLLFLNTAFAFVCLVFNIAATHGNFSGYLHNREVSRSCHLINIVVSSHDVITVVGHFLIF